MEAIGIDCVDVRRIQRMMDRYGDQMLGRIFSEQEIRTCMRKARPAEHFAARVAAKEAFIKCMGELWSGFRLRDITVVTGEKGAPQLVLIGRAREAADSRGFQTLKVSLTHTNDQAMAVVLCRKAG